MTLNEIAGSVEACSGEGFRWHDRKGEGISWNGTNLQEQVCFFGGHNTRRPAQSVFCCRLSQLARSARGGWGGGPRSVAWLWPLWAHFSDRHLSLCRGLCAVIDYWPPQQSHHSAQLRSPQRRQPLSPHRSQNERRMDYGEYSAILSASYGACESFRANWRECVAEILRRFIITLCKL